MPLPPVLSNTSPMIKFVGVGLLDLLPRLYHTIWIADTVQVEYATKAAATDPDLTTLPWLMVQPVTIDPSRAAPQQRLGYAAIMPPAVGAQQGPDRTAPAVGRCRQAMRWRGGASDE